MENTGAFLTLKAVVDYLVAPPEAEWRQFESLFHPRTLQAGDYFIRAGETSDVLGFINAGLVRFFYHSPQGAEFNKSFCQENQFMAAYSAYLTQAPARFSIQALEESHILVAKLKDIVALFDRHNCWEKLGRILAEQLYIKKEQREAEFLLDDAETRYLNFRKQYPRLEGRLAQYHIASYIGITPVALSRIRKQLKKK
jgi:CRP-like cAMP-binding protein